MKFRLVEDSQIRESNSITNELDYLHDSNNETCIELVEKIIKKGSKWQLQSEKGKNMGAYDTKEEAEKRLQQIEYFKHQNEALEPIYEFHYDVDYRNDRYAHQSNCTIWAKTESEAYHKAQALEGKKAIIVNMWSDEYDEAQKDKPKPVKPVKTKKQNYKVIETDDGMIHIIYNNSVIGTFPSIEAAEDAGYSVQ